MSLSATVQDEQYDDYVRVQEKECARKPNPQAYIQNESARYRHMLSPNKPQAIVHKNYSVSAFILICVQCLIVFLCLLYCVPSREYQYHSFAAGEPGVGFIWGVQTGTHAQSRALKQYIAPPMVVYLGAKMNNGFPANTPPAVPMACDNMDEECPLTTLEGFSTEFCASCKNSDAITVDSTTSSISQIYPTYTGAITYNYNTETLKELLHALFPVTCERSAKPYIATLEGALGKSTIVAEMIARLHKHPTEHPCLYQPSSILSLEASSVYSLTEDILLFFETVKLKPISFRFPYLITTLYEYLRAQSSYLLIFEHITPEVERALSAGYLPPSSQSSKPRGPIQFFNTPSHEKGVSGSGSVLFVRQQDYQNYPDHQGVLITHKSSISLPDVIIPAHQQDVAALLAELPSPIPFSALEQLGVTMDKLAAIQNLKFIQLRQSFTLKQVQVSVFISPAQRVLLNRAVINPVTNISSLLSNLLESEVYVLLHTLRTEVEGSFGDSFNTTSNNSLTSDQIHLLLVTSLQRVELYPRLKNVPLVLYYAYAYTSIYINHTSSIGKEGSYRSFEEFLFHALQSTNRVMKDDRVYIMASIMQSVYQVEELPMKQYMQGSSTKLLGTEHMMRFLSNFNLNNEDKQVNSTIHTYMTTLQDYKTKHSNTNATQLLSYYEGEFACPTDPLARIQMLVERADDGLSKASIYTTQANTLAAVSMAYTTKSGQDVPLYSVCRNINLQKQHFTNIICQLSPGICNLLEMTSIKNVATIPIHSEDSLFYYSSSILAWKLAISTELIGGWEYSKFLITSMVPKYKLQYIVYIPMLTHISENLLLGYGDRYSIAKSLSVAAAVKGNSELVQSYPYFTIYAISLISKGHGFTGLLNDRCAQARNAVTQLTALGREAIWAKIDLSDSLQRKLMYSAEPALIHELYQIQRDVAYLFAAIGSEDIAKEWMSRAVQTKKYAMINKPTK